MAQERYAERLEAQLLAVMQEVRAARNALGDGDTQAAVAALNRAISHGDGVP